MVWESFMCLLANSKQAVMCHLLIEATVFLGTFNAAEMPPHNPVSGLYGQFLWPWFLLWHALSTVGPYIDSCVPFQMMSNQLNIPQVASNQVAETSQGRIWHTRVSKQTRYFICLGGCNVAKCLWWCHLAEIVIEFEKKWTALNHRSRPNN